MLIYVIILLITYKKENSMQRNITISVIVGKDQTYMEIKSDFLLQQTLEVINQAAKLIITETPNVTSNYSS